MFGYITIAPDALPKERSDRYRSFYCGLCRTLRQRHGSLSRITLSYDLTFLYILLNSLKELNALEKAGDNSLDGAANLTAQMLGVVYRYKESDYWADTLAQMGQGLGRFIYLMDAYEDLPGDLRKGRYNPLAAYHQREDYESFVHQCLTMLIAECTEAFEMLPVVQDADLLRNILYGGCWMRYHALQKRRDKNKPAVVKEGTA